MAVCLVGGAKRFELSFHIREYSKGREGEGEEWKDKDMDCNVSVVSSVRGKSNNGAVVGSFRREIEEGGVDSETPDDFCAWNRHRLVGTLGGSSVCRWIVQEEVRPMNSTMPSKPLDLLFFILVISFNFPITESQEAPFVFQFCPEILYTVNSTYQSNLMTLLSSLSSNAATTTFYNTTVKTPSETIYGLFMCRGDVPVNLCKQCILNATHRLSSSDSQCYLSKQAIIWYDECMVRYSSTSFFSDPQTVPEFYSWNMAKISNTSNFMNLLVDTMKQTSNCAASSPLGNRYATNEANISEIQTLYCLAQCTQDLSPQDCSNCLAKATSLLRFCCEDKQGGRVLFPSCNIRYELYPFYRVTSKQLGPVPETKYSQNDSACSQVPAYISHNCSTNENDMAFKPNRSTLLYYMSRNATNATEFQTKVGTMNGLFMCRGDMTRSLCKQCVENAIDKVSVVCDLSSEAIVWYNDCLVRYSNRSFLSRVETSPRVVKLNVTNPEAINSYSFAFTLSTKLADMANETGDSIDRYKTGTLKLNENQTLYIVAQCTRDLSSSDCGGCLSDVIGSAIPWSRLGSVGGMVLYPSCYLRFDLFQFYAHFDFPTHAPTQQQTEKRVVRSRTIIWITVSTIVSAILFSSGYYLKRRKGRKNYKTVLKENFGHESTVLEPLQFDLTTIEAATNNFSLENKIGKGGFGEVYKGILDDGRHIAVKRLSKSSKQGAEEFKNEILLIAKLQHRNLVAFIGFCLEEQEKILIYEYVTNKSLDYILFDTQQQNLLSWNERYKIIGGIARGILYLHEYSRLKVIHRDLKPSNILLDENMNPKISDFGLARIVEIDQHEGSTNRIVGTYGYMSPEYAMLGQFSEKSDVFSFGVMILEIITGKKNIASYDSSRIADGLLSFVWREWRKQTPLNIVDPKLRENYSKFEAIKCIQIGLLCVQENPDARPTILAIVSYLSSHSIELPSPQEPAFILHNKMDSKIVTHESCSSQSANNSIPLSVNEMSISEFYPR
ncbi:cysteine-rich receptor-like protein kinase 7 [Abrus precatorius]|uniref:Cysteine-rich receptor-like protein kinase 7 n=1 Tax=Abrus precatorius TaxID=3816 RepID=A0A8B8K3I6_ABRPR|nr:cysteine-rich receptor-like protein kinase 7 [Abrus precatorius]